MDQIAKKHSKKQKKQQHGNRNVAKKIDQHNAGEEETQDEKDFHSIHQDLDNNQIIQQTQQKPIKFTMASVRALQARNLSPAPVAIVVFKDIPIYESDLMRLSNNGWLNDVLIDFHIEFLKELMNTQIKQLNQDKSVLQNNINVQESSSTILNLFAFQSLDKQSYNESVYDLIGPRKYFRIENHNKDVKDQINSQTQVSSILEKYQRVYVVVNESNYHWILVELSLHEDHKDNMSQQQEKDQITDSQGIKEKYTEMIHNKTNDNHETKQIMKSLGESNKEIKKQRTIKIRVFDSLGKSSKNQIESRTCVKLLQKYLSADFYDLYEEQLNFQVSSEIAPTQAGGPQCGVFVCFYLQLLFFNQQFQQTSEIKKNFSLGDVRFSDLQVAGYRQFMIQNIMKVSQMKSNTKEQGNIFEDTLKHKMIQLETYLLDNLEKKQCILL